jgi:hypothetical protein
MGFVSLFDLAIVSLRLEVVVEDPGGFFGPEFLLMEHYLLEF